ncbi:uncharacterized protein LOC121912395 [Thunnus maccoyii]|uniref:uncharacterized protein LOC121912395 n=1 Tax=Thunnus maccoyii TaxID=8240 RepID=UPI001C4CFEA3|nr:uncharacterized protein LOC121912395 [Thunnus maccoyii]
MACGVHLGIFLICLVQAEHVRCSWATQAQGQNSNTYVGFSQQDSGLRRLGGSYLQNQFRQASVAPGSAQSSSFNTDTGYRQGLSSSGYTHSVSQPVQSGYTSVRLVQSSSVSKPNWRTTSLNQLNAQKVPKNQFDLSAPISSGGSVSKFSVKKQNDPTVGKSRTWPVKQGIQRTNQYLSSSSASILGPRESYSFRPASHQSAAQKPPSTAFATPAYYGQSSSMLNQKHAPRGFSHKSSHLFSPRAPAPASQRKYVQMQTSASAPARRSSSRSSKASKKPSSFSYSQNERTRHNPSQTEAGNPYNTYKPTSNRASSHSLKAPTSSRTGTSAQNFAPTEIHSIPQRFGGFAIRRLKEPDQKEVSVQKPQQTYTAPSQQLASYKPPVPSVHQESKWKRVRPHLGQLTGAAGVLG